MMTLLVMLLLTLTAAAVESRSLHADLRHRGHPADMYRHGHTPPHEMPLRRVKRHALERGAAAGQESEQELEQGIAEELAAEEEKEEEELFEALFDEEGADSSDDGGDVVEEDWTGKAADVQADDGYNNFWGQVLDMLGLGNTDGGQNDPWLPWGGESGAADDFSDFDIDGKGYEHVDADTEDRSSEISVSVIDAAQDNKLRRRRRSGTT